MPVRLETLPKQIGAAGTLETLTMSHNKFRKLPSGFTKLKGLKTLDMSHNW